MAFVASKQNPADFVSRGQSVDEFLSNTLWLSGPSILWQEVATWPKFGKFDLCDSDLEMKKAVISSRHQLSYRTLTQPQPHWTK